MPEYTEKEKVIMEKLLNELEKSLDSVRYEPLDKAQVVKENVKAYVLFKRVNTNGCCKDH